MTTLPEVRTTAANTLREPYRGIQEFRYVDAQIYFGRDFEARRLLRLITIYRGVLLYGDSGVGKSSLVNAKTMPLAVEEGYAPERIRVQPVPGAEIVAERIVRGEADDFLPSLFDDGKGSRRISMPAAELLRKVKEAPVVEGNYPLLVFDQFEELVTLTEQAGRRGAEIAVQAQAAYESIVSTLLEVLRDDSLRVKLLFVFREDYYAKLTKFFACHPTLIDNYLRVEPLHSNQLDAIITGPFRAVDFGRQFDTEVTDLLKSELRERSDSDVLNLSEVQIACLRLWRAGDPLAMLRTQHVSGLLETYFSEAIGSLPEQLHGPAEAIMDALVTQSGTRDVVSETTLLEILETDGITAAETTAALTELDQTARVIRRERRNDVFVYEIVSEFLVPRIMRRKVEAQTKQELEQRFERTRRIFKRIGLAAVVTIVGLFAMLLLREYQTSNEELRQEVRALRSDNSTLETKLDEARADIENNVARAREAQRDATARAAELATERDAALRARQQAEAQARASSKTRDVAIAQSTRDNAARETAERERADALLARDNAVADRTKAVAEKDAAVAARQEANRMRDGAVTEAGQLKQSLQKMTAERDEVREKLAQLTTRHTTATAELKDATTKLQTATTKLQAATTELRTVKSERSALVTQLAAAKEMIGKLEADVAALKNPPEGQPPGRQ
jgi:hypothetical protein